MMTLTSEQIETWMNLQLDEATDDMFAANVRITPESLSAFFEENYQLPYTVEEAKAWLDKQDWYRKD